MVEAFRALVVAEDDVTAERVASSLSSPGVECGSTAWTGNGAFDGEHGPFDCLVSALDAESTTTLQAAVNDRGIDVPVVRLTDDCGDSNRPQTGTDGRSWLCLPLGGVDSDATDAEATDADATARVDGEGAAGERLRTLVASTDEGVTSALTSELGQLMTALSMATEASAVPQPVVDAVEHLLDAPAAVYLRHDDELRRAPTASVTDDATDLPSADDVAAFLDDADDPDTESLRTGSVHVAPLDGRGALVVDLSGTTRRDALAVVDLVSASATAALERLARQDRLERLHEATRRLMSAETDVAVSQVATETASEVLALDLNSVHLYREETDRLEAVAATDEARAVFDEVPSFRRAESLAWQAYESGDPLVYGDVREASDIHNPDTPIRSELVLPLGDYGVFLAGTTTSDDFDETTVSLGKVFAANVEAALDRAARETELRAREAELERQNDRLDEFASVVSHDLRNPLAVARGNLEMVRDGLAADTPDLPALDDRLERVDRAHERMEGLVENLLTLARQGRTVGETEPVDVDRLVAELWTQFEGGRLDVAGPLGTVEADGARLRDLFENLFSNVVRHAGDDVTVFVGRLDDDAGFYVADDGPGIPPADRDAVFEHGYTTAEEGTGLGLAIVRSIAEAHGWSVRFTEGDAGGARVEFRTDVD